MKYFQDLPFAISLFMISVFAVTVLIVKLLMLPYKELFQIGPI